jgi:hypothetical protein
MIVRYNHSVFGALVESRTLLWGLGVGTFILTFAFSSWHDGLWRSDAAPVMRAAPTGAVSSHPLGPRSAAKTPPIAAVAPAFAAMIPPPANAPPGLVQSEPQSEPYSTPGVDDEAMRDRSDRGAERGPRSH